MQNWVVFSYQSIQALRNEQEHSLQLNTVQTIPFPSNIDLVVLTITEGCVLSGAHCNARFFVHAIPLTSMRTVMLVVMYPLVSCCKLRIPNCNSVRPQLHIQLTFIRIY